MSKTSTLTVGEILGVFYHGFKLDLSSASYISSAALLFIVIISRYNVTWYRKTMRIITIFALVVCSFLAVVDLELYKFWGYRLDTTPLLYINTPGEMIASTEWYAIVRQLVIFAILLFAGVWAYKKWVEPQIQTFGKFKIWHFPVFLLLLGSMIIPIRGGLKLAPLNTGTAYFSEKTYANHAANNVVWNLAFSFTYYGESTKNPFVFTEMEKARAVRDSLLAETGKTNYVLKTRRPNIILIILESFNNKMISELGGVSDATPNLNKYCKEGIVFSNFYSNGDRSDKGLVAIHSGFPSQAIASIIKFPYKTETLPFFTKDLKKAGYSCSYYYGGDINFAAMRSYIQNAGYEEIISDHDFPKSTYGAKWGVHDEYVFQRFFEDIEKGEGPFLKTFFTLSSHEPFDVPYKSNFDGNSDEQKFLNAGRYTDSCLGYFIERLRKTKLWDSSLIIITSDHGSGHPLNSEYFEPIRFKVPMIWIGGALSVNDSIVDRIGAQSDIASTLLAQLDLQAEKKYHYGKNLLDNSNISFAFYSFNSGFGLVTDSAKVVFDNTSKTLMYNEGKTNTEFLNIGKSIQQVVYDDFLKR